MYILIFIFTLYPLVVNQLLHWPACIGLPWQDLNGVEYIKLRPTAPAIVKLVCGKCEKNGSLSNGECLKALKEKRNAQFAEAHADSKKRKAESVVEIDVCGTPVQLLCPPKRVNAADLQVCLDPYSCRQ